MDRDQKLVLRLIAAIERCADSLEELVEQGEALTALPDSDDEAMPDDAST